jgi:hypothetical protein
MFTLIKCDNESPLNVLIDKEENTSHNYISYNHEVTNEVFTDIENLEQKDCDINQEAIEIFRHSASIEKLEFLAKKHPRIEEYRIALYSSIEASIKIDRRIKDLKKIKAEFNKLFTTKSKRTANYTTPYPSIKANGFAIYSEVIGEIQILRKRYNDLCFGKEYYNLYIKKNEIKEAIEPKATIMSQQATFNQEAFIFSHKNEPCISVLEQEYRDQLAIRFIFSHSAKIAEIIANIKSIKQIGLKWKQQDILRDIKTGLIDYNSLNLLGSEAFNIYIEVLKILDHYIKF